MSHPIHPALVHVPIGGFTVLTLGDFGHLSGFIGELPGLEFVLIISLIVAIPAMIFGVVDFLKITDTQTATLAIAHAGAMGIAWILYLLRLLVTRSPESLTLFDPQWLSIPAFFVMAVGGWFGGNLVYRYGVGINKHH